jgi:glycosyltransferase involved in cell wall biosynthesis
MKILQVNNQHRVVGGSDIVAANTVELLRGKGHEVYDLTYDSRHLGPGLKGRLRAFAYGLYSSRGCRTLTNAIHTLRPDLVHVHEIYPFFSPWALQACRRAGIPIVMTCHDYRLTCPTAFHQRKGGVCEMCLGGREYWCALNNCRDNLCESVAYFLRYLVARKLRLFHDNVTLFVALSEFARRRFIQAGIPAARIEVIPNMVAVPESPKDPAVAGYLAYVGRVSPEKGIDTLLAAARKTALPLYLAGGYATVGRVQVEAPPNVRFLGLLTSAGVADFYRKARVLVLPSECFEGFPLVLAEAMSHGLPVIASRIGGLPDIIEDGVTGLLFEPGNADDLAQKMEYLWNRPDLCRRLGQAGRAKVVRDNHKDIHYYRLTMAYQKAIRLNCEGDDDNGGGHVRSGYCSGHAKS